jgi:hypothetical protein
MDKQKIHEPPMSFKLFACGVNCELQGCNSTIAKVTMGFKLWAALLRSSMSKDFKWHSGSSCLQKWGRGEIETNTPGLHHWSLDCCKL